MTNISWTAAILAGGQGRRLGGFDKSALVIEGRSILDRQLALLRPLTPHLLIVGREASQAAAPDISMVTDRIAGAGALGGLYTALLEAPTEQVLVIGCDMPFLTAPFLAHLAELGRHADVVVPADEAGRHPLCASYARRIAPVLKARIDSGDLRVLRALDELTVREIGSVELEPFNRDGRLLLNINTPEDLARARC